MRLDRRLAEEEGLRDLGVRLPVRDQQQHIAFARGEAGPPFASETEGILIRTRITGSRIKVLTNRITPPITHPVAHNA